MTVEQAIARLELELRNAREVEQENKAAGRPAQSTAYDAGRVAGLSDALDVLRRVYASAG